MIHNTYLVKNPAGEILAHSSYWPVEVKPEQIEAFIDTREEIQKQSGAELTPELPLSIGNDKFMASEIDSNLLLIFATDELEDEGNIRDRIDEASKILTENLDKGLRFIVDNYEELIQDAVTTRLKIALVGEGGVGKTTTLHLLLGDTPPLQYVPTIALNLETVENIRFGNYSLVLWDFAGQERFRKLWKFYFHGADVIFLVCDSTLRNVIISKDILKMIRRDAPKVPIFAIANKQDKPKAMKPEVIQKILGVPTYPMVAIDKDRREEMLRLLMNAAAQFVGVSVPDLPPSEVLTFVDTEPSEVIREIEEEEEEEELEVVETVLVDEEGRVVEESDGEYEVIEEVVEVVEEDTPEEESVPDISTETEIPTRTDVSEKAAEATVEDQAISIEQKGSEQKEAIAFSLETTAEQAPISDEQTAEQIDIKWQLESEMIEAKEQGETAIVGKAEWETGVLDYHQSRQKQTVENGREMAKEIISEALDADDIVASDLETATGEEIDAALKAFSSNETLPKEDEEETTAELEEDVRQELEFVLGEIECMTNSVECDEEASTPVDPDSESIREMEEIFGEMNSKKENEEARKDRKELAKRGSKEEDNEELEEI